jgi:hypothetical protein
MEQSTAQRRLVKSPPELWAEVSSEDALGRHLAPFGEIRITRVEPETTVAWEGERASGTVELEPAGWGTKVTLTATATAAQPAPEPEPEPTPDPAPVAAAADPPPPAEPVTAPAPEEPRRGFFARLFRRRPPEAVHDVVPQAPPAPVLGPPAPDPEPTPPEPDPAPTLPTPSSAQTVAILTDVLDDLGAAHHRPFSRG